MAGSTLKISGTIQFTQGMGLNDASWSVEVYQPTAGATTNPTVTFRCILTEDTQDTGGDGTAGKVQIGMQITNNTTGTSVSQTFTQQIFKGARICYGSSTSNSMTHTTGTDSYTVQVLWIEYMNSTWVPSGNGSTSKSGSGKIYWTSGGGTTTYYSVYFQDGSSVISSLTQSIAAGKQATLPSYSKSGYVFAGWKNGGVTYAAGAKVTITSDLWFSAQWTQSSGGGGSTDNSVTFTCANSADKIYAATSDILGTYATNNGSESVKVTCSMGGTSREPLKIMFMPDNAGTKYDNSFAVVISWGSNGTEVCQQEIIFGCSASSVIGATWKSSNNITLSKTVDDTTKPSTVTITRVTGSTGTTSTVTRVTMNDYWISNVGYSNGTANTAVGSYNTPAVWYWHNTNKTVSGGSTTVTAQQLIRKISWTKPASGTVLYYVIIFWKGYATNDNRNAALAFAMVAGASATSIMDDSSWFGGNSGNGKYLKITVHPVFATGPNPSFATAQATAKAGSDSNPTGMGRSAIEDWAIWYQFGYPGTDIHNVKFYESDKSTILKDSNKYDYNYYVKQGAKISAPTDVRSSGVDQSFTHKIDGWYKKEGTGSWGTTALTNLGSMGTTDLSFAQKISEKTGTVTYYSSRTATSTKTFNYGDGIGVDNGDENGIVSKTIDSDTYTIPNPTKEGYMFLGFTYNDGSKVFTANWISDKYVYIYNGSAWKKYRTYIYDGSWKPATYFSYDTNIGGWV